MTNHEYDLLMQRAQDVFEDWVVAWGRRVYPMMTEERIRHCAHVTWRSHAVRLQAVLQQHLPVHGLLTRDQLAHLMHLEAEFPSKPFNAEERRPWWQRLLSLPLGELRG
jgi:hypothetical protein